MSDHKSNPNNTPSKSLLDLFISKTVAQVRDSKGKGTKAILAKRSLEQQKKKLAETKRLIKETAISCERNQWTNVKLVMIRVTSKCTSCGEDSHACVEQVYLEKTHKRLGMMQVRQDSFSVSDYPELPRETEEQECQSYVCHSCFSSYSPSQLELEFEPKLKKNADPLKFTRKTKRYADFHRESKQWDENVIRAAWNAILPKTLLLTHQVGA